MTYKEKVAWLQQYLKAREKANFLGGCVQEMETEAEGMRTRLDGMPGAGRDTARLARSVEKVEETRKMADAALDRCAELRIDGKKVGCKDEKTFALIRDGYQEEMKKEAGLA